MCCAFLGLKSDRKILKNQDLLLRKISLPWRNNYKLHVRMHGRSQNLIKKIFLGFEGGDGTRLFMYLFCPALLLCYGFLLSLSLSTLLKETKASA